MLTFYRCVLCRTVISWWDIKGEGCCRKCGGRKMSPSNLSWFEKLGQIIRHPKIWEWPKDPEEEEAEFPGEAPWAPETGDE